MVDKDVSGTEANLAQARQRSAMAHRILVKLKEMGLPENLDEELSKLCTDLGDIWSAQLVFTEKLDQFLNDENEWNAVGDCLADMKSHIEHITWHAESVIEPIESIGEYAYGISENA